MHYLRNLTVVFIFSIFSKIKLFCRLAFYYKKQTFVFLYCYLLFCCCTFLSSFIILQLNPIFNFVLFLCSFCVLTVLILKSSDCELTVVRTFKIASMAILKTVLLGYLYRVVLMGSFLFFFMFYELVYVFLFYFILLLILIWLKPSFVLKKVKSFYFLLVIQRFTKTQLIFILVLLCSMLVRILLTTATLQDLFIETSLVFSLILLEDNYLFVNDNPFSGEGILFQPLEPLPLKLFPKSYSSSLQNRFLQFSLEKKRLLYELATVGYIDELSKQLRNPQNTPIVRSLNIPAKPKFEIFNFFRNTQLSKYAESKGCLNDATEAELSAGFFVRMHEAAQAMTLQLDGRTNTVIPSTYNWTNWFLNPKNQKILRELTLVDNLIFWNYFHGVDDNFDFNRFKNEFDGINNLLIKYGYENMDPVKNPKLNEICDVVIKNNSKEIDQLIELKSLTSAYQEIPIQLSNSRQQLISENKDLIELQTTGLLNNNQRVINYIERCSIKFNNQNQTTNKLIIWVYDQKLSNIIDNLQLNGKKFQVKFKNKEPFFFEFKTQKDKTVDYNSQEEKKLIDASNKHFIRVQDELRRRSIELEKNLKYKK